MEIYQIELLEPKAKQLMQELVNLNLIRVKSVHTVDDNFLAIVNAIRENAANLPPLSPEEISEEVEKVRENRYGVGKK